MMSRFALLLILLGAPALALAQTASEPAPDDDAGWRNWQPDPASIAMPHVAFPEGEKVAEGFDKYFYFHRQHVSFADALSDIRECDARARGLWIAPAAKKKGPEASPYGLVGDVAQALIFGPAQNKLFRRANLRRCMFFKGYGRYGLEKSLYEAFNFQRVEKDMTERDIQKMLASQAKVASGPLPATQELGL